MSYKQQTIKSHSYIRVRLFHAIPAAGHVLKTVGGNYALLDVAALITDGRETINWALVELSEDARFKPGDHVFFDAFLKAKCGDSVVASLEGKICIKILREKKVKGLRLVPQDERSQCVCEEENCEVLGVVVWGLLRVK